MSNPPKEESPFDYQPRTRLVFGAGTVERCGELAREIGIRTALVVTDQGVLAAGHVEKVLQSLAAAKIQAAVFSNVRENPTTRDVEDCLQFAKSSTVDGIIGVGGGSS